MGALLKWLYYSSAITAGNALHRSERFGISRDTRGISDRWSLANVKVSRRELYEYMISFRFSRSRCSVAFLSRERQFNDDNEPWYCQQLLSIIDIEHQPFSYDLNIVRTVIYSAIK